MQKIATREELIYSLQNKAVDLRREVIELGGRAGGGHFGSALSCVDLLVVLYYHVLKVDPRNPSWPERDRFILSKGHAALALYPVLADRGFFEEERLAKIEQLGSPLGMHPSLKVPGVEMSSGSLGHNLGVALGMALAGRLDGAKWRVFCLLGDGECHEGSVWEAAMAASHHKLGNLCAIVDRNMFCIDGPTEQIMALEPFSQRWEAFGWRAIEVDGHDFEQLLELFENLPSVESKVPTVIIAKTVKGKGVSFMEGVEEWHYGGLDSEKEREALADIERLRPKSRRGLDA